MAAVSLTAARETSDIQSTISTVVGLLNAGRKTDALAIIEALDPQNETGSVACTIIGLVAMSAAAHEAALRWLDRATALDPSSVEALKGRATALADAGRIAEAHEAFLVAFRAGCVDPVAFYHHGNVLHALGRSDLAIAAYDQALRLRPAYPEVLRAGAGILRKHGRPDEALRFLDEAIRLRPTYFEALLDRTALLESVDAQDAALATLDKALALFPANALLLNNRGVVLTRLGQLNEAISSCNAALISDPGMAQAYLNRGHAEIRVGRFPDALRSFEGALAVRPDYVEALSAKGVALKLLGRFAEAGDAFEAAVQVDPASVYALTNRGELKLLLGDFDTGWQDYDARWAIRGHEKPVLARSVPEWAGQQNPGRVAVFADQAAGDVIHFARYVPVLRAAGADITFVCRPRMQRLLRDVSEHTHVVGAIEPDTAFDFQIPLSNLPFACRTTEATIPSAAYITAEDELAVQWREKLGTNGFKVGICWRGSQDWRSDPKRSVPLAALRPLASLAGVRLISLQMADNVGGDAALFAEMGVESLGPDLDSGADGFIETAAVMANLDCVVSCDTSLAHLAGALGRPTFVLLQKVPEWRYMVGRDDSPWYPTMQLFRQTVQDGWADPIARLCARIGRMKTGC